MHMYVLIQYSMCHTQVRHHTFNMKTLQNRCGLKHVQACCRRNLMEKALSHGPSPTKRNTSSAAVFPWEVRCACFRLWKEKSLCKFVCVCVCIDTYTYREKEVCTPWGYHQSSSILYGRISDDKPAIGIPQGNPPPCP